MADPQLSRRMTLVPRPRLTALLDESLERRLTVLSAGAGFGKTTLLSTWAKTANAATYTCTPRDRSLTTFARGVIAALRSRVPGLVGEELAALLGPSGPDADAEEHARARTWAAAVGQALAAHAVEDLALVLDDLHEVSGGPAAVMVEALCREAPDRLHVVVATRDPLPFTVARMRGHGQLLEITARDLVFTPDETAALWRASHVMPADLDTAELHALTGGWPVAVRLAVEALSRTPEQERHGALQRLRQPDGPLFGYLAEEVFDREPQRVRALLAVAACLDCFSAELCEELGILDAAATITDLSRRGLYLEPCEHEFGWWSVVPLFRAFVTAQHQEPPDGVAALLVRAADWFERTGHVADAVRCLREAGDHDLLAAMLRRNGHALLSTGHVDEALAATGAIPQDERDEAIERLEGEARQIRGDWEGALACFRRVVHGAAAVPAGLAWRMGLIYHQRGELGLALAAYQAGCLDAGDLDDEALLLAWTASLHWLRGEIDRAAELAEAAFERATSGGGAQALATVHTVLAMVAAVRGERAANDTHYEQALEHAEQAHDVLLLIRIRANRGSRLNEEGYYEDAVAELDVAIRLAELSGFAMFRALALSNRGEALFRLGRFEEAINDLEAARSLSQRLGSRLACYPLCHIGHVRRARGDRALARAAYEEAILLAEPNQDLQGLVPALAGLALTMEADDPTEALRLAERAVALGPVLGHAAALITAGRAALAVGDTAAARSWAERAAAVARSRRDRAAVAETLELQAELDAEAAPQLLEEALAIWKDLRVPLGQARVELALGARLAATAPDEARTRALSAERVFRRLGARADLSATTELLAELELAGQSAVTIVCLGGFRVLRRGEPVPPAAWQSRKARQLMKMLCARLGAPVHREQLADALWPDEEATRAARRLSVQLSTVRAVLDPDKRFPPDHFIRSDGPAIRLDTEHVLLDVAEFLEGAEEGLRLWRAGDQRAEALLSAAEAAYVGDFLEEDAYEDWPVATRERARETYVQVTRTLATGAASTGDYDLAARYLLRVLEHDRFDEPAHLELVRAFLAGGRHGQARRAYRTYGDRMAEIGVEAAAFPVDAANPT